MKQLLWCTILIISFGFLHLVYAAETASQTVSATLTRTPPPPGGGGGTNPGGIIAGGVVGGVAAAGGAAALSPLFLPGLLLGAAAPIETPLCPTALCDGKAIADLQACGDQFCYLLKAIAENCLHNECNSKYILIADNCVSAGGYNIATFKLPKELATQNCVLNVKMTQISDPFGVFKGRPEINSRMYFNTSICDINKLYKNQRYWKVNANSGEVPMDVIAMQGQCGIAKKYAVIHTANKSDVGILVTSYNMGGKKSNIGRGKCIPTRKYAVLLEFSNLPVNTLIQ